MATRWILSFILALVCTQPTRGQPWQLRWQQGQTFSYKVTHHTHVAEMVENNKVETVSKLDLVKTWHVLEVDKGIATLKLTLTALRNEQKRPDGEVLLFDSANLDKSTPELRDQMAKFVGQTLAVLRVDASGRVNEVKVGPASRYEEELPFGLVLPADVPQEGQGWLRSYAIVLAPPLGTGEKHEAVQKYECVKIEGAQAKINVKTQFKALPESIQERLPLLQKEMDGQVVFDVKAGRTISVRFRTDRTVENHQGPRSSYHFQSRYEEELLLPEPRP